MKNIKLYLGGSLFSESNILGRKHEYKVATEALPNAVIFSPVMADFNTSKDAMLPTAKDIFEGDLKEILDTDYFIADLGDMYDTGLHGELGVVAGLNHYSMKNIVIIGVLSDIRLSSSNKYEIPPYGMNHFQLGLIESNGYIVKSFDEALELIKKLES